MLALKDRWHIVSASIPGLADAARVTLAECEAGLLALSSPDKYSRSKEHEGRRIEAVDGGWLILNGEKYRNKMNQDERREYNRIKQREYRGNVKSCVQKSTQCTHTDTDTDTDTKDQEIMSGKPDPSLSRSNKNQETRAVAKEVLIFLNEKTERNFRDVPANLDPIISRLKEGYTQTQIQQVIAKKRREWISDEKMRLYLRPKTLFNRTNFANYAGELLTEEPKK